MEETGGHNVAVIIPCHSYIEWLPEALESIEAQTVPPYTVVMVEDGRDDIFEYHDVWEAYKDRLPRLRHVTTLKERGVCAARNRGFELAKKSGVEWVIPLDEDDLLRPRYIERVLQSVDVCPNARVHYTDWNFFGDDLKHKKCPEYSFERLRNGPFITSTALIHVDVWEAVHGYDVELTRRGLRWEDYLFYLEAGALGFEMARVGLGLLRARKHGVSGTTVANQTIEEWRAYAAPKLKRLYDITL